MTSLYQITQDCYMPERGSAEKAFNRRFGERCLPALIPGPGVRGISLGVVPACREIQRAGTMDLSIIIPIYNEEECILLLEAELTRVVETLAQETEVLFVDDGSKDGSYGLLRDVVARRPWARVIRLKRNFGQTQAMAAGFEHARGETIVCMDGDLQNDPEDIPRLLEKMDQGFDIVSGWRKNRHDKFFTRRLPSMAANWLIGQITGVRIHDYGCSLKAYNARVVKALHLYSDMHRFIPALAWKCGARIAELPVNHRRRAYGRSKYGLSRIFKVVFDLMVIKLVVDFSNRPIHAFGIIGTWFAGIAVLSASLGIWNDLVGYRDRNIVLFLFAVLTGITALYFWFIGVLGDLIIRVGKHDATDYARSTAVEVG